METVELKMETETVEQFNQKFNENKPKKKGLMTGLIVGALAIIIVLALVYFLVANNPKFIFSKAIDRFLAVDSQSYESIKMNTEIRASVDLEDTTYQEELAELEKLTFKVGTQMSVEEKQQINDLGLEYDNQAVIDAQVYYNDGEMYAYLEGLFDKYIELDMDEEMKAQLDEIFEAVTSKENLKNTEKAIEIAREELKSQIKENGKFDKKKDEIEIGEDEVKVTKSTLTISEKQLYKIAGNMFSNLAKNDEFIDCLEGLEEQLGESPKDLLKEAAEEFKNSEGSSKNNIKISLYTKGLLNNNLVAVTVEIYSEYDESTAVVKVVKEDENLYAYNVAMKEDAVKADLVKGKVKIEKDKDTKKEQSGTLVITAEIIELGTAKLEIDYAVEYDQGIDKINTSNSVNIEDLTDADMQEIATKLMEKPLIGVLIAGEMGGLETDMQDEFLVDPDTQINIQSNSTTAQDEVKDYGYSVKYTVPTGFVYSENTSYDDMKFYDLENPDYSYIDATVTIYWDTETEYIEDDINWDYNYYLEDTEYYKNVNLSELKSVVVGEKTFKYVVLSYETTYGTKAQDVYIWYPLGEEHLFTVELEATDTEITEDIIKGFLNINVTESN